MINTERRLVKMDTAAKTQQSFHGTNQITFSIRDFIRFKSNIMFFWQKYFKQKNKQQQTKI